MDNGIITIYPQAKNKELCLKFRVGSGVRHKTPKEARKAYWPKRCVYNNEDENNRPNLLSDKN